MEFSEVVEVLDRGQSIDVQSEHTFESLMIDPKTLTRLKSNGFMKPSPVQAKAIPIGLLGRDMLVQAKSGTGKTLVFSVIAAENVDARRRFVQKLIVTPTREIATQIRETLKKVVPNGVRIGVFVGGIPLKQDLLQIKNDCPQIVVGTTGRLCQLAQKDALDLTQVDFFALDEADKLMDECFQKDINYLISLLPPVRQVAVFSATYPRSLDELLSTFLRDAALVRFNSEDVQLVGIKQYVIPNCSNILESLSKVLKTVQFSQALVFCDTVDKCEPTCSYLKEHGHDAIFVSSAMSQRDRQHAVDQLRHNKVKILVSSDLTARGIDADSVNMVVNIDTAQNPETYFHRIGRAARFGAQGAAITLLENDYSARSFRAMVLKGKCNVKMTKIEEIPHDLPINIQYHEKLPFFVDLKTQESTIEEVVDEPKELENSEIITENEKENIKQTYQEKLVDLKTVLQTNVQAKVEKPKFKFVPTRQKANKKFYMRGEMMSIRDSVDENGWRKYAESKYDLSQEPFLDAPIAPPAAPTPRPIAKAAKKQKYSSSSTSQVKKEPKKVYDDGVHRYSRQQMIQIQNKVPKEAWLSYTKSKHDTSEEPWELDPSMRCSFEERLRRIRNKEKMERKKVMEDRRKKIEEERGVLVSSGRTTQMVTVPETSFTDYLARKKREYEEYKEKLAEGGSKIRYGPVIPMRDPPAVYRYRVHIYAQRLKEIEQDFHYELEQTSGRLAEMQIQTESSEVFEKECQTNDVAIGRSEKEDSEDVDEVEEYDETNDYDGEDEIVDYDDVYDEEKEQGEEDEEEYEDEEEEDSDSEAVERLQVFATEYRKNVDFNIVFQSYFNMMNEEMKKK